MNKNSPLRAFRQAAMSGTAIQRLVENDAINLDPNIYGETYTISFQPDELLVSCFENNDRPAYRRNKSYANLRR